MNHVSPIFVIAVKSDMINIFDNYEKKTPIVPDISSFHFCSPINKDYETIF